MVGTNLDWVSKVFIILLKDKRFLPSNSKIFLINRIVSGYLKFHFASTDILRMMWFLTWQQTLQDDIMSYIALHGSICKACLPGILLPQIIVACWDQPLSPLQADSWNLLEMFLVESVCSCRSGLCVSTYWLHSLVEPCMLKVEIPVMLYLCG